MTTPKRLTPEALAAIEEGLSTFPDSPRRRAELLLVAEVRAAWALRDAEKRIHGRSLERSGEYLGRAQAAEARVAEMEAAFAENERLRRIAAHVPGDVWIKAKEAAGLATTIRPAQEEPSP